LANPNYLDPQARKLLIQDIKSFDNVETKRKSLKDYEIYNDNAYRFVYEQLEKQLGSATAKQMPIVSNINISKAVVNKEATIYSDDPERSYENISESDEEALENIYKDCMFNSILGKSNKYYKLRNQAFLQVVPKYGKLKLRLLHRHQIDVVPDELDPEIAYAYVISSFDKTLYTNAKSDGQNQTIGDADDYKALAERYQVFTPEITFIMNGYGDVVGEILENPIQMLPFVDIAKDKDFEFFVRIGQALTDFTVDFNVAWSDLLYVSRMQGFSVGVLSGDANLKPDTMTIGPNRLLFLPSNPSNPDSKLELDFKSPTPNIEASLKVINDLVGTFLSTRGIDSKSVSANNNQSTYSSALEKLLSMIDQFKATKEDFDLYKYVEKSVHKIVVNYLSILSGTQYLDPKYSVTQGVVNSEMSVQFKEPQMVETASEKLANAKSKIDLGIADRVSIYADIYGVSEDKAQEEINSMVERRALALNNLANPEGSNGNSEEVT
jgi:hypothetical protein